MGPATGERGSRRLRGFALLYHQFLFFFNTKEDPRDAGNEALSGESVVPNRLWPFAAHAPRKVI